MERNVLKSSQSCRSRLIAGISFVEGNVALPSCSIVILKIVQEKGSKFQKCEMKIFGCQNVRAKKPLAGLLHVCLFTCQDECERGTPDTM